MLQLCMFSGFEGPLTAERKCYFTMFGGCELRRPTLARQLLAARNPSGEPLPQPRIVFITVFGGTSIQYPTLAEEYLDLREAIDHGHLDAARLDFYNNEIDRWTSSAFLTLTLFGGFDESELPAEEEELDAIALQRHLGRIGSTSSRILESGVGMRGAQRRAIVQHAAVVG
jgi:hypothetical protein